MKAPDGIALMNRLKDLLQTSKKAKITAAVVTFMMVTTSASALYSVRDVAVYRKLIQQINQYKQMIEQNKDLLMMKGLEILGLDKKIIKPINDEVDKANEKLNKKFDKLNSLLNGKKDGKEVTAEEAIKTEFIDLSDKDVEDISPELVGKAIESNNHKLEVLNKEIIDQMTTIQEAQVQQQARMKKLMQLAEQNKGLKGSIDINNEIKQEQLLAQQYSNQIDALTAKKQSLNQTVERINERNADKLTEKAFLELDSAQNKAKAFVDSKQ
ncbi:MAG: hypothetical protein E7A11_17280 [Clostridium sp.]|jgi:hypothetical protein|uniref:hypothetical protein n=1 Tax=Clostridium sp. TaxID=1506 RepID=UPI002902E582|nr:hypothetical protein [Clostridium sp.]MDU1127008.1 hypothetical protein [Clostridium sp.]